MASPHQPSLLGKGQREEVLLENALNALAKALKALTFYPSGHPQRDESVASAFQQLQPLLNGEEIVLLWSREACTVADRPALKSGSLTAKGLAREMLTRKLQRLTIVPEVTLRDLAAFLAILTIEAPAILARGGVETEMTAAGITTIGANEVDLDALKNGLEKEEETPDISGENLDEEGENQAKAGSKNEAELQEALELDALIAQLKEETSEPRYLQLLRGIIDAAEKLRRKEVFAPLVPALTVMLAEHDQQQLSDQQREYVRFTIEQMTDSPMASYLLDQSLRNNGACIALLGGLCALIGKSMAYPLIQRLCVADALHERKTIASFLTRTGEAGIPALLSMLRDERWYVVRNMVTILGEIASPTALKALQSTAAHPEQKVRKEVIKSLLKISPHGAESTLVSLIGDSDADVVRQAIYSLGSIRARAAVRPLLEIITTADPFLKELALKKQALVAIGRIGDRQATDALLNLLGCRGWLAPRRWQELKIAIANALGQMGDESAIPLLKQMARQDSPLGKACGEAADNLERLAK